ncbi:hypothetical protein [Adhaeribacter soli]|uniref:Uncharacterized protein n=1 Tax=Adhaeribacter soli TaxID=2607655 RepID=A0A5N1J5U7_9BACT|nr:hypothetical protein [Adhaeribacter soli]KAA9340072.1 hypothetical protein F0P94_06905 [Adhaeribacter soli]
MKKLIIFLFMAGTLAVAKADEQTPAKINEKATALTRTMARELQLNELEYIKVKALNTEKLAALFEARNAYQNDPEMQERKFAELEQSYDQELTQLLNRNQYEKYLAWERTSNESLTSFLAE